MRVSFGSSGAPTLVTQPGSPNNRGVASITRTGTGAYTIVLQDTYARLLGMSHIFQVAAAPASPGLRIVSEQVATLASPSIAVQFSNAGTATDPASGEIALIKITVKNSSA